MGGRCLAVLVHERVGIGYRLYLCDSSLSPLGGPTVFFNSYQVERQMQVVSGADDLGYFFRQDSILATPAIEEENDSTSDDGSEVQAGQKSHSVFRLGTLYIYR